MYNLLAVLGGLYIGPESGTVLSLGWASARAAPASGSKMRCDSFRRYAPHSRSALRRIFSRPPAAPYTSATRKRPAAVPMILRPLRSRITTKVYRG